MRGSVKPEVHLAYFTRACTKALSLPCAHAAGEAVSCDVQCAHRRASIGISILHSGHFLVVGSAGGSLRDRAINALIGVTTKKYTAIATSRKATSAFRKSPNAKTLPWTVKAMAEKSGLPTRAAM